MTIATDPHLLDTRRAFDSVAAEYDGPSGNNALIQRMRDATWRVLLETFPPGARLLDVGCGTGLDAVYLAAHDYQVLATDWSPLMVERTRHRAEREGLAPAVRAELIGAHELHLLTGERFDGIFSNFGPLNCVPSLEATARHCFDLLAPGGRLVLTVIGRWCPWEVAYYAARGQWRRALVRAHDDATPVGLNGQTVWTRYWSPREFYAAFAAGFVLTRYRALGLFLPPPYLIGLYERLGNLGASIGRLDDRLGGLPWLRDLGDHFLMVLTRRR